MDKETALIEAILFLESEPQSEESLSRISELSADLVEIAIANLKEKYMNNMTLNDKIAISK